MGEKIPKSYVVGFLFSTSEITVQLIQKIKPDWQKGKWNGIGGKIENFEHPKDAMRREFMEEANLDIEDWREFTKLRDGLGSLIHFYVAFSNKETKTMTAEPIATFVVKQLGDPLYYVGPPYGYKAQLIPNLRWLIPMALDKDHVKATIVEEMK